MRAPYFSKRLPLNEENINKISENKIGNYVLFKLKEKKYVISYVGRSDNNLRKRLKDHIGKGRGEAFRFTIVSSKRMAFLLECRLYHEYYPKYNTNHPAIPALSNWKCPISECEYS